MQGENSSVGSAKQFSFPQLYQCSTKVSFPKDVFLVRT